MSDIEEESVSTHAAGSTKESVGPSEDRVLILKNKRKQLRGRFTRAIKRIRKFITEQTQTKRRLEKEIEELRKDFHMACELLAELYDFADASQISRLDEREDELTNDVFGIEQDVENHFRSLQDVGAAHPHPPIVQEQNPPVNPTSLSNHHEQNTVHEEHPPAAENTPTPPAGDDNLKANISSEGEGSLQPNETSGPNTDPAQSWQLQASIDPQINSSQEKSSVNVSNNVTSSPVTAQYPIVHSFDGWIDELEEF